MPSDRLVFTHRITNWLPDRLTRRFTDWPIDSLTKWKTQCLMDSLSNSCESLTRSLIHSLTHWLAHVFYKLHLLTLAQFLVRYSRRVFISTSLNLNQLTVPCGRVSLLTWKPVYDSVGFIGFISLRMGKGNSTIVKNFLFHSSLVTLNTIVSCIWTLWDVHIQQLNQSVSRSHVWTSLRGLNTWSVITKLCFPSQLRVPLILAPRGRVSCQLETPNSIIWSVTEKPSSEAISNIWIT